LEGARERTREALKTYEAPYRPDQPLFREALSLARRAVELAPDNPEALRFLAELNGVTGFYGPAFAAWERFVAAGGVLDAAALDQLVRAGTQVGYARYQRGDLEGALAAYDRVADLAPERPLAHRWRGRILLELERPQRALRAWETVLRLRPGDAAAEHFADLAAAGVRYGLPAARAFYDGVAHYEAGRRERARERFAEAARLNPAYAEAWAYVGRVAFEAGDYTEAERAYGEASALEPDNATYRYFLAEARRRAEGG
jgi:tetratricopeptide (TPR) repeat protein